MTFIPTLQLTPDSFRWQLYLLPALLLTPFKEEVAIKVHGEFIYAETVRYWFCFGIGCRRNTVAYGEIENGKVTRGAS
mgnify:CR=1 FL=1